MAAREERDEERSKSVLERRCARCALNERHQRSSDEGQPWRGSRRGQRENGGVCIRERNERRRQPVGRPGDGRRHGQHRADSYPQCLKSLASPGRHDGAPADASAPRGRLPSGRLRGCLTTGSTFPLLATATLHRCSRRTLIAVAQLDRVPAVRGGLLGRFRGGFLGISRRLDIMSASPRPALFRRETTATCPALFRRLTAARVVLTGERLTGILVNGGGQGDFKSDEQIGKRHARDKQAVSHGSPELEARPETHGGNTQFVRGWRQQHLTNGRPCCRGRGYFPRTPSPRQDDHHAATASPPAMVQSP